MIPAGSRDATLDLLASGGQVGIPTAWEVAPVQHRPPPGPARMTQGVTPTTIFFSRSEAVKITSKMNLYESTARLKRNPVNSGSVK